MIVCISQSGMLFILQKKAVNYMQNEIEILYSDKNIAVCVKPVGFSSEDTKDSPCVPEALRDNLHVKDIFTLHRLDVGVGGVMVYALNKSAGAKMSALISENKMKKEYSSLVYGVPDPQNGVMEDFLFKDSRKNKTFVVDRERKGVKKARLFYDTVCTYEKEGKTVSLVHITLDTGRSHQIRAQFSSRKMPLVGDGKYGAKDNEKNIALASVRISFTSPFDGKELVFEKQAEFHK
jgi:23S rRNA pseudouridine1911/1915/1917 synthase